MTGLGLPPHHLQRLLEGLDRAVRDGAGNVDPARVAKYLRRYAVLVDEPVPKTVPKKPVLPDSPHRTVTEVANQRGAAVRTVRDWCSTGRLPGAVRLRTGRGRPWSIPATALECNERTNHG